MAVPTKLLSFGKPDFQTRQGIERQVRGVVIDIGLDLRPIEFSKKEFELPWPQPMQ